MEAACYSEREKQRSTVYEGAASGVPCLRRSGFASCALTYFPIRSPRPSMGTPFGMHQVIRGLARGTVGLGAPGFGGFKENGPSLGKAQDRFHEGSR